MPTSLTELRIEKASSPSRLAKTFNNNSSLIATVQFYVIVFLALAVVAVCFPDLGAIIAQYNQF